MLKFKLHSSSVFTPVYAQFIPYTVLALFNSVVCVGNRICFLKIVCIIMVAEKYAVYAELIHRSWRGHIFLKRRITFQIFMRTELMYTSIHLLFGVMTISVLLCSYNQSWSAVWKITL